MRLTGDEVAAIKAAAREAFGASAVVRLFGSRVDDSLRGGDIDLLVEADPPLDEWHAKTVFEDDLFRRIEPHEYPSDLPSRFARTRQAYDLVSTLRDAVARLDRVVTTRKLLDA